MEPYNPKEIESKWQKKWADDLLYKTDIATQKKKMYVLDMFPYPSGEGLHVGHPKGYIATDIYSRMKKMSGFEVLHPMGWDAFGLPAEEFAIKNKVHPRIAVEKNIARFKEQLSIMGFNYDWSKEINTTDPEFYKWTQWIFKQMWKKGLAYESNEPINWCPSCKTGLANEDLDGDECERCGSKVEKKPIRQWVLKITDYADRMIEDLGKLEWPEGVKLAQKNWIGRSEGSEIDFDLCVGGVPDGTYKVKVFTTRADTLMGATYLAISAELAHTWMDMGWKPKEEIQSFMHKVLDEEKTRERDFKEVTVKEGIYTEVDAIHPITKERLPVWIANYVLPGYGTGALMAVPAHDERDFEFAKKYELPIVSVVQPETDIEFPYTGEGILVNSGAYDGLPSTEAKAKITAEAKGKLTSQYKLKDWVFARQRYWGEPFPIVFDENHTPYAVADNELPVKLPEVEKYEPTGTGESPLAMIDSWVNIEGFIDKNNEWKTIPSFSSYSFNKSEPFDINDGFGGDAYQSSAPIVERNNVACIIKHPTEEKFLLARWKQVDWNGFATGGIEEGHTPEDTARQEVREETGFTNIASIEVKDFVSHGLFYHVVKKQNRLAHYRLVVVELGGLEQNSVADEEKAICDFEWIEKDKVEALLTRFDMKSLWQHYTTGKIQFENPIKVIKGKRETNTMPQWAGSSWYYLRFADPKNDGALTDAHIEKKWQPVDVYVGGDHATRHLIYARFWHKFLFDIGVVSDDEPFKRLEFLGFILAEDGRKMSKRLGNVINPDDVIAQYGADTLRLYEMFMAPFEQTASWDTKNVAGVERFLERLWRLQSKVSPEVSDSEEMKIALHKTIKKVGEDIENFKFNTAISSMMICLNLAESQTAISQAWYEEFLKILAPFAPHMTEELWHLIGREASIHLCEWPAYDESLLKESHATIAVQIAGKLRGTLHIPADLGEIEVLDLVKKEAYYEKYIAGNTPKKVIFIPNKLINIVI